MQVSSAMFAVAVRSEGAVECRIADETRTLRALGPGLHANPGNWITAFWLAIVCREQDRMTALCEVPLDVMRASGTLYDEFIYLWIDALQAYWLERPGLADKLLAAIEASYPALSKPSPSGRGCCSRRVPVGGTGSVRLTVPRGVCRLALARWLPWGGVRTR